VSTPPSAATSPSTPPASATDLTGETDGKPVKQKKVKVAKVKKPKRDKFNNPEDLAKSFIVQPAEDEGKDSATGGGATGTSPAASPSGASESNAPGGSTMAQPAEPTEKTEIPVPASDSGATTTNAPAATPTTTAAPSSTESPAPASAGDQPAASTDMSAPAATPAPTAAPQPASAQGAESAPTSGKGKHKHVLRKKHESSESQAVIKAPEPEATDVSDLKEKPVSPPTSTETNMNTETVPSQ
jgi:hypothetical protein